MTRSPDSVDALTPVLPFDATGPAVPTAARAIVEATRARGWFTLAQRGESGNGHPFLCIEVGIRHPQHHYRITWHRFDQIHPPHPVDDLFAVDVSGTWLRLFSKIYTTGGDAPNLKAIHYVIAAHPQDARPRADHAQS